MKNVLVTGGVKRLGYHIVKSLALDGTNAVAHFNNSNVEANALLAETFRYTGRVKTIKHDLLHIRSTEEAHGFLDDVEKLQGKLSAVINNASFFEYDYPGNINVDILNRSLQINFVAPMLIMEAFLVRNENINTLHPIVINILDSKVLNLNPDYLSYTLGKSALTAATKMYAIRYADSARIYGLAPSMFLESGAITVGRVDELVRVNLLNRPIDINDIVSSIHFLLNGQLKSGEILSIDAGQNLLGLKRDVAFKG